LGLSGKSEEKRPFWKCRLRWDDCIEIDKNEAWNGFIWLRAGTSGEQL
jgi:hypothetical protein